MACDDFIAILCVLFFGGVYWYNGVSCDGALGWCKGDIEGAGVSHVCGGREKLGEDITRVLICSNSHDHHFSFKVILTNSVVADVDAATVFVHRGLGRDVFRCLVVSVQVEWPVFVSVEL